MRTMKAAYLEDTDTITVKQTAIPKCEKGDALVKVESCGICGSDIRSYHSGLKGNIKNQIPGHEIAGVVVEAGGEAERLKIGDRVAITPDVSCGICYYCKRGWVNLCIDHKMLGTHFPGGFAQFIHLPALVLNRGIFNYIPEEVNFDYAVLSEPAASVIACHENNSIGSGDTLVIIGDGTIGCLHAEVARSRKVSRIVLVGLNKLSLARRFTPDYLIDAAAQDPVYEVMKITNGLGADVVIAANPVAHTQQQGLEMLRKRGKLILFGGLPKTQPLTQFNSNLIHYNEISVIGSFSYTSSAHSKAIELIRNRMISAENYLDKFVSLDDIKSGIDFSEQGKALKVAVKPWI